MEKLTTKEYRELAHKELDKILDLAENLGKMVIEIENKDKEKASTGDNPA